MRPMLVDFIDLRCSVSVPFALSSLSPQHFVVPASSFLSELNGYMTTGACIRHCFHCMEHLFHCCTVLTEILRKSDALRARFRGFFPQWALKCSKLHGLTWVSCSERRKTDVPVCPHDHVRSSAASFNWLSAHPDPVPAITTVPYLAARRFLPCPSSVLTGRLPSVVT